MVKEWGKTFSAVPVYHLAASPERRSLNPKTTPVSPGGDGPPTPGFGGGRSGLSCRVRISVRGGKRGWGLASAVSPHGGEAAAGRRLERRGGRWGWSEGSTEWQISSCIRFFICLVSFCVLFFFPWKLVHQVFFTVCAFMVLSLPCWFCVY